MVQRIARFGAVGGIATLSYLLLNTMLLASLVSRYPAAGNMASLSIAYAISYLGHSLFTFAGHGIGQHRAFLRFVLVSAAAGLLVSLGFALMVSELRLSIPLASLIVALTYPAISFVAHHRYTFAPKARGIDDANGGVPVAKPVSRV